MSANVEEKTSWLERPVLPILKLDLEKTLYWVFIILAIASRFWLLGERAMSHDESLHTFYSWNLYQGGGYSRAFPPRCSALRWWRCRMCSAAGWAARAR